jgi:hypothetical protein
MAASSPSSAASLDGDSLRESPSSFSQSRAPEKRRVRLTHMPLARHDHNENPRFCRYGA